jgi:hypothetical protein
VSKTRTQIIQKSLIKERLGMAKAVDSSMNYYEKLVKKVNQSMKKNPNNAMIMDMASFEIIAKSSNFKSLGRKMPATTAGISTIVFQKPNQRAAWIL